MKRDLCVAYWASLVCANVWAARGQDWGFWCFLVLSVFFAWSYTRVKE